MKLLLIISFLLISILGSSQSKSSTREKTWVYDINIVKDPTGHIVKIEKITAGKGSEGGPVQVRYFQTLEKKDKDGIVLYSTRERLGENNVDPEIVKQYGTTTSK